MQPRGPLSTAWARGAGSGALEQLHVCLWAPPLGVQAPGHSPCPGQSQSLLSEEMSLLQPAEVVSGKQEEKTWKKSFLVEGRGQACLFLESKQPLGKERAGPTSAHGLQSSRSHTASWPRAQPSHEWAQCPGDRHQHRPTLTKPLELSSLFLVLRKRNLGPGEGAAAHPGPSADGRRC